MELRAAWEYITYARIILWTNQLIVEGDSLMMVAWLQRPPNYDAITHLQMHDIWSLLPCYGSIDILYIYYEVNNTTD